MNKLYKYLPFGIQVQYKEKDFNLIGCFNPNKLWLGSVIKEDAIWDRIGVDDTDVKPILRPFEDLTKELPLTKTAAEMIGMKEGEVVVPLKCFLYMFMENWADIEDFTTGKDSFRVNCKDWFRCEADLLKNKIRFKTHQNLSDFDVNENAYDFLRAMQFNLDFKEGEYIKLKD